MAGMTPALTIRIAANIEELKANLASGQNLIETTTAGMQKLGVPQTRIDHLVKQADPKLLAGLVSELQSRA